MRRIQRRTRPARQGGRVGAGGTNRGHLALWAARALAPAAKSRAAIARHAESGDRRRIRLANRREGDENSISEFFEPVDQSRSKGSNSVIHFRKSTFELTFVVNFCIS